ncbi:MAG: hypothetical protein E7641_00575 [Ruminococcaceae bacterium]|nr:hypothetical protein [Oscillospiraceae bacterium]
MNVFDIITISICALSVLICVWKGFLKIALKTGAIAIAAIVAKFVGPMLGEKFIPDIFKASGKMSASAADKINETIATVVGTVVLFVVLFILLRLISGLIAKAVTKVTHTGKADRIIGGIFGLILAVAVVFLFAEGVKIYAAIATAIKPDYAIFDTLESSLIFKYFL